VSFFSDKRFGIPSPDSRRSLFSRFVATLWTAFAGQPCYGPDCLPICPSLRKLFTFFFFLGGPPPQLYLASTNSLYAPLLLVLVLMRETSPPAPSLLTFNKSQVKGRLPAKLLCCYLFCSFFFFPVKPTNETKPSKLLTPLPHKKCWPEHIFSP